MEKENVKWLEHLEEAVPVEGYGNKLSMYLIALEAWRRGIKVNFFTIENPENKLLVRYSLEYGGRTHRFESSRGDLLTNEAFDVCENKYLTKKYLEDAGLNVPKGEVFSTSRDPSVYLEYVSNLSYPVVVKPVDENAGKGVFSNVDSQENLLQTISFLKNDLGYDYILIEEFIPGTEYRILTIDGKVEGAVNRIPANIIGNGKDTIQELINKKNESRHSNPNISKKTIKLDREVLQSIVNMGYELDSVLVEGQQIFLRSKSNVSAGGDPIDVTDDLPEEIKKVAEKASEAIPGLGIGGLDLIIDPDTGKPTIIEINTKPMIGLHVFPIKGKSRDVVKPIVDMYFPETKGLEKSNLYFDFEAVIAALDNEAVTHIQVEPPKITKPFYTRKFIIYSQGIEGTYRSNIRLIALKLGVYGYIKRIESHLYEVIAATRDKETMSDFKYYLNVNSDDFETLKVKEFEWDKPVKIGFRIMRETSGELREKIKKEKQNNKRARKELKALENKIKAEKKRNKNLDRKIKRSREKINSLQGNLDEVRLNLRKTAREKNDTIKKLNEEILYLKEDRNGIRNKYKDVVSSRSWKLTKPLRKYNFFNRN